MPGNGDHWQSVVADTDQSPDQADSAVWSSSQISNESLHMGRDCTEGNSPGTITSLHVKKMKKYKTISDIHVQFVL